jgi:hypothetical protein
VTAFEDLQAWAAGVVVEDLKSVKRQITEYGSIDLEIMGMGLLEASSVPTDQHTEQRGMEMALVFYLQGKVARCISAMAAGKPPSDDTLRDLRVYSLMLAHVREFGHWRIGDGEEPKDAIQLKFPGG